MERRKCENDLPLGSLLVFKQFLHIHAIPSRQCSPGYFLRSCMDKAEREVVAEDYILTPLWRTRDVRVMPRIMRHIL